MTAKLIGAHPKRIFWKRFAQGIATARRMEANPISECPFTMYQILSVTQSEKKSCPNTNLVRLGKTAGYLQLRSFTAFVGPFSGPVS